MRTYLRKDSSEHQRGFTLIEILVVITIMAMVAMLLFVAFSSIQKNTRDTKRKSDLQTVASMLQRFHSDYSQYPEDSTGRFEYWTNTCINEGASSGTDTVANWGTDGITCGGQTFTKQLPKDPKGTTEYCYDADTSTANKKYSLYANLEKTTGNSYTCNGVTYNYRVTSND